MDKDNTIVPYEVIQKRIVEKNFRKYIKSAEYKVLEVLYLSDEPLDAEAVSQRIGTHWVTANRELRSLEEAGIIQATGIQPVVYWVDK